MRCARPVTSDRWGSLFVGAALTLLGCGVSRPSGFAPVCPNYEAVVRPVLQSNCTACHGGLKPGGGYTVGDHSATVSRSDDGTPRVAPGELASPLLQAARGELKGHGAISAPDVLVLEHWVVACRAAPRPHDFHPIGWATPTDPDEFHGKALRASGYAFAECKKCHGEDLRGGKSGVDCNSCHTGSDGPRSCDTCHGDKDSPAPPQSLAKVRLTTAIGVGAHRAHVKDGPLHKAYGCEKCHFDVKKAEDDGHYQKKGVFLTGPAEVFLPPGPAAQAKWDRTTATCTNTYCHAPVKDDTSPTRKDPVWTRVGLGEAACGTCHGAPPSSHQDSRCEVCHAAGYADGGTDLAIHLNGKVELKGEKCDSCHSGPQSPAFVDLYGRSGIGAHDAHLKASRLRGPMACGDCHLVPTKVDSPGHIDHAPPATVFPASLATSGRLAWAFDATPTYNATTKSCGSVYCHGGGVFPAVDTAPGLNRTPVWTGGPSQAACGTCHGLPPKDGSLGHNAAVGQPCALCHSGTVYPDGGLIFTTLPDGGLTSKHMDGKITGQ